MPYGYNGKILHVNLTAGTLTVEEPPESFYRKYLGGQGTGLYYILQGMPAGVDPLGPENMLAITLSVVTGAAVSGQSRVMINAKSPLTGAIGDSQAGGFWPAEAKFAGFDAFIIRGRATKPVYLWVHDGQAELRDAAHLWSKVTGEAEAAIREELGDSKIQVLQIGPAGEKLVRYACLLNMCNRANGRTGMGAVMGSKNLKAIAVRGKKKPDIANPQALSAIARWGARNFPESDIYGMGLHGTAEVLSYQQKSGGLPTRNWASGVFEGYETIDGTTMSETILKARDTCYACVVRCKRVVEVTEGPFQVAPHYGGPEYETLSTFGSYCGVSDLAAIARANQICNMYGVDTISAGATIAWAMDCFERGIITAEDTGGIELRFGNAAAMVKMTEMIARREGFGDLLAEGMVQAARRLGPEAETLVTAVKGNPLPAHMPQVKRSLALIYAVNPYGADHQSHEHDPSYGGYPERMAELGLLDPQPDDVLNAEKVRYALYTQQLYNLLNTLGLCQFVWGPAWQLYGPSQLVDMVRAVTGWNVSLWELMKAGERSLNMMRAFNDREGFTSAEDKLPPKLFQPLIGGPSDGIAVTEEEMAAALPLYYAMCGWDAEGRPTRGKLAELGLAWVADELGLD
ncbi:MAG: aldehyde ferredoxin oxidoreductase family protein [Anaerolineae bacterium]|jgi:aldehyde:ferredoxin oxidoreductase|nr:aldehyde ferredoxin oxidoreductase family protein [Anaerolineae bacterium]MDH7473896.1 aldehyde ferredoxin oxidoreductase family protein [Anaerolineae bacterium]